jgi:hypothetical protein
MAKAGKSKAVVYAPPTTGFPHLAVLFWRDGSVLRAEPCSSIEEGEKLIAAIARGFEQIASAAALHRKRRGPRP